MATVAGNLFELKPFSGLKLLDISLPPAFLDRYQGPQFGVAGTRRLTGVEERPLIGTILNAMTILDVSYYGQNFTKGVILLLAVLSDSIINPRNEETAQQGDI